MDPEALKFLANPSTPTWVVVVVAIIAVLRFSGMANGKNPVASSIDRLVDHLDDLSAQIKFVTETAERTGKRLDMLEHEAPAKSIHRAFEQIEEIHREVTKQ